MTALCIASLAAQEILDQVVARVGRQPILLSDVRAATALGLVTPAPGTDARESAILQVVDRQLMLIEVARVPPTEPDAEAIDQQVAAMKVRAGAGLDELLLNTGIDEARIRELARDTLRIQAYLNQRFGTTVQVSDEDVRRYYEARRDEFTRNGVTIPFEEAEGEARRRAAAERRRASIADWLTGLRARADVSMTPVR